jgi:hypothetical protein
VGSKTAGWQPNGKIVCDTSMAWLPKIVSDGNSGAIICWTEQYRGADSVNNADWDIYAQRVDSGGNFVWQSQGVPVCSLSGSNSTYPAMIPDGKGGAIVAWEDDRGGLGYTRVFTQRLDSLGNRIWGENGTLVCNQMSGYVDLCTDGHGGAIIAYVDGRNIPVTSDDIYAQRMDSAGNPVWQADGVPVCAADSIQFWPHMCSNNRGGAVITWEDDYRNNGSTGRDVYAQMVDSSGNICWTVNGEPICVKPYMQRARNPVSNNIGGGIIGWWAFSDTNRAYLQSLDSIGDVKWGDVPVRTLDILFTDGRGGGIGASGAYVNRVDSVGNICWGNGVQLFSDTVGLRRDATEDRYGGIIVIREDNRNNPLYTDLYVQRVDSSGLVLWNPTGVPVCTLEYSEYYPKITYDGFGGAIFTWYGHPRPGSLYTYLNIVVHKIYSDGIPAGVTVAQDSRKCSNAIKLSAYPNPVADILTIEYTLPYSTVVCINITNILGQKVKTIYKGYIKEGKHAMKWNGKDETGKRVSSGVYICTLESSAGSFHHKLLTIK